MLPAVWAAASLAAQLLAGQSQAEKEEKYRKEQVEADMKAKRRSAITSALGARDLRVTQPLTPPDLTSERVLGALGGLAGNVAASKLGGASRSPGAAKAPSGQIYGAESPSDPYLPSPFVPQGQFDDPSETLRRRLQQSYGGGSYGIG